MPKTTRRRTPPPPDEEVEAALLKRALGFRQQEIHAEEVVDKQSGDVLEVARRRTVTKEIAPDVRALLFWLKNRRPDRWRDRFNPADDTPEFDFDENDGAL